jgi:hypothetical protein
LGKFRGVEFAPIAFKLTPGTSDALKDSKGRHIWTVTAKPLGRVEQTAIETDNTNNEGQVLKLLVDRPGLSVARIAEDMGWFYASGEPDKSKVQRILMALDDDGLVRKIGGHYQATKAGKTKAGTIVANRPNSNTLL